MSTYNFVERARPKRSNVPQTFDITETRPALDVAVGTLTRTKSGWEMLWLSTKAKFPTKLAVRRHLSMLGHRTTGLE